MIVNVLQNKYAISIVLLVLLTGCEIRDEISPRNFAGIVLKETFPLRSTISDDLANYKKVVNLKKNYFIENTEYSKNALIDFGWITDSGAIIAYNKKLSTIVVLEPVEVEGKIDWECVVYPQNAQPKVCDSPKHLEGVF